MPERIEWIEHWVYEVVKVSRLPVPNEIRGPTCMIGPKVWYGTVSAGSSPGLSPARTLVTAGFTIR
jgi:hypothetical protein